MGSRNTVGEDERARPRRENDVHGPLGEVLGDDGPQPFGERGLHRHQRLLDVLRRVLPRGQEYVVVGVIGAGPFEDLEMDLLADLGLDSDGILPGPSTHGAPPRRIIAFYCYTRPMRVLAVETSTLAGGVAVLDGDVLVGQYLLDVRVTHSERLMVALDRLLGDAGWTVLDLEGLAVAVGPGSFTGLRVGLSTVKGLAVALGVPVAAVPTLDAMAASLPFAALPVCPVLDARKGEVYASLYRWDGGAMRREWEYQALAPEALAARLGEAVVARRVRLRDAAESGRALLGRARGRARRRLSLSLGGLRRAAHHEHRRAPDVPPPGDRPGAARRGPGRRPPAPAPARRARGAPEQRRGARALRLLRLPGGRAPPRLLLRHRRGRPRHGSPPGLAER